MVSFTSIIVFALTTAAQIVPLVAASAGSLPSCSEVRDLSSENAFSLQEFKFVDNKYPTKLIPEQADDVNPTTTIAIEKSQVNDRSITTIETGELSNSQTLLRVFWDIEDGNMVSRFFQLTSHQKCRVAKSAQYGNLDDAAYYQRD